MIQFLTKHFIKDFDKVGQPEVRVRYGIFAGTVGILLNLCLFAAKFSAGVLTSSISITADAFNNLSDAGSSIVTLVGFKMAGMPSDNQHPFGHGRIEYLSGLAVSMVILLVGVELVKNSFDKILHPQVVVFSAVSLGILILSVLVKLWMSLFNRTLSKRIDSSAMRATAMDSLTDAVATSAVILGALVSHFAGVNIDGWVGMLVALFILYTGFTTARDSLSPLLGQAPDPELVRDIEDKVLSHEVVVGTHDLIIHDYGPGRRIISLHAEVPCNADILSIHDEIDLIELQLRHEFNCDVTIHMDPIAVDDIEISELRERISTLVSGINPEISIHDFRLVRGSSHTNLIFDVVVPHKFSIPDQEVARRVREGVRSMEGNYFAVICVEKGFT